MVGVYFMVSLLTGMVAPSISLKLTPDTPTVTLVPASQSLKLTVDAALKNETAFWVFEHHTQQFALSLQHSSNSVSNN